MRGLLAGTLFPYPKGGKKRTYFTQNVANCPHQARTPLMVDFQGPSALDQLAMSEKR